MPEVRGPRTVWAIILAVMLTGIAVATLTPAGSHTHSFSRCLFCAPRAAADALANVVGFAPVGIGLRFLGRGLLGATAIAAALSAAIEVLQMVVPGRDPGLSDMLTNTAGAAAGAFVAPHLAGWIVPPPGERSLLALKAAALTALAWFVTGYFFAPAFAPDRYWGQWNPVLDSMQPYGGQVLVASIGGTPLPPHELDIPGLSKRLEMGEPVHLRVAAGPPPTAGSDIFSIANGRGQRVLMIAANGDDVIVRHRTRSAVWRFDQPDVRFDDALEGVEPGAVIELTSWRQGDRLCLSVGNRTNCEGLGLADGASLVLHPSALSGQERHVWRVMWMALLVAPVGFYLDRSRRTATAVGVLVAAAVIVPLGTFAVPARGAEWAGIGVGLLAGLAAQAAVRTWIRFRW